MSNENRGLASADEQTRERVAREGGKAVSQDIEHMAEIGRKGRESVSQDTKHMAEIDCKGGESSRSGGNQSGSSGKGAPGLSEEKRQQAASSSLS